MRAPDPAGICVDSALVKRTIAAVVRNALAVGGFTRVALLADGSPEAKFCADLLEQHLGLEAVVSVAAEEDNLESVLRLLPRALSREQVAGEWRRLLARVVPNALSAAATNKTALLLGGPLPPEPLLPFGDLYASEIEGMAGGWSAPRRVRQFAEAAGGMARLDAMLRGRLERRDPDALHPLGEALAAEVEEALATSRWFRLTPLLVPKLGVRTLGVDLFE